MKIRIPLIVFLSAFGMMIIGSIIGNILESSSTYREPTIGAAGISAIKVTYFVLFCIMGFSIVPLFVHLFIYLQVKIGNGEFFLVKFFREHEQAIVYGAWIMLVIGFGIIFTLGGDDVLNDFK